MTTSHPASIGCVLSVNVGRPRQVEIDGRVVTTAIWKSPVAGRSAVSGVNVEGDDQGDRRVHGGADKAVYAYSSEDYEWWQERLGRKLSPGTFGENLTTEGIGVGRAVVGQRWEFPDLVLEVSQPRLPCYKLGIRMDDAQFPHLFKDAGRFGTYLRIVREGSVAAGDQIIVGAPPAHGLTITDIGEGYPEPGPEMIMTMLGVAELPEGWRTWAERASVGRDLRSQSPSST